MGLIVALHCHRLAVLRGFLRRARGARRGARSRAGRRRSRRRASRPRWHGCRWGWRHVGRPVWWGGRRRVRRRVGRISIRRHHIASGETSSSETKEKHRGQHPIHRPCPPTASVHRLTTRRGRPAGGPGCLVRSVITYLLDAPDGRAIPSKWCCIAGHAPARGALTPLGQRWDIACWRRALGRQDLRRTQPVPSRMRRGNEARAQGAVAPSLLDDDPRWFPRAGSSASCSP
jgi:hypothetical protein